MWDRALSLKDACADVDWKQGRDLAQSAGVRNNELHFWQQREPEVEMLEEMIQGGTLLSSEEAWRKYEADASKIEALLNEEAALTEKTDALSAQKDTRYTFWFWLGATALIAAVVLLLCFICLLWGIRCFMVLWVRRYWRRRVLLLTIMFSAEKKIKSENLKRRLMR